MSVIRSQRPAVQPMSAPASDPSSQALSHWHDELRAADLRQQIFHLMQTTDPTAGLSLDGLLTQYETREFQA